MWATFLFVLGLFGIFLINTFGTITTTNQQDYTLLKNTVEAAMLDSIDYASYRAGFYLCINNSNLKNNNGVKKIQSSSDYKIVLNTEYLKNSGINVSNCDLLVGEYKLNKDVFAESFLRRFSNNVNNNKSYEITIQEIIEYPPKVSVRVDTYNTYGSNEATTTVYDTGDYNIRNQIDSILEEKVKRS